MKKFLITLASALALSAPAFAQTVSVGVTDGKAKNSAHVNAEYVVDLENDVEGVVEARLRTSNQHVAKVGLQKEFVTLGPVAVSGRLNLFHNFGKTEATGLSVEPTASFKLEGATVKVGYEMGDTIQQRDNYKVRNTTVSVMYPFALGNFGVQFEKDTGAAKESAVSFVYSLKN